MGTEGRDGGSGNDGIDGIEGAEAAGIEAAGVEAAGAAVAGSASGTRVGAGSCDCGWGGMPSAGADTGGLPPDSGGTPIGFGSPL